MATFLGTNGILAMFHAVGEYVDSVDTPLMDVHTVTLVLDGRHGEFNLVIEATDEEMEDHRWEGIAHRTGGVSGFGEVKV
jgi:nitrate reductase NapAB chaperone NapD